MGRSRRRWRAIMHGEDREAEGLCKAVGAHTAIALYRHVVQIFCTTLRSPIPSTRDAHLRNFPRAAIHTSSRSLSARAAAPQFWLGGGNGNGTESDGKNAGVRASLWCCLWLQLSLRTTSSWPSSSGTATDVAQTKAPFWIRGRRGSIKPPIQAALANRGFRSRLRSPSRSRMDEDAVRCKTIKVFLVDVSVTGALFVTIVVLGPGAMGPTDCHQRSIEMVVRQHSKRSS